MTDYVVAIPTFKRYNEIIKKTLPTLQRGKVPKGKIHVFVANKTEEKLYREKMDPNTYGKIVVGKKGLVNQRIYISEYFPKGTNIVSLDDDVEKMQKLKGSTFKLTRNNTKTLKKKKNKTLKSNTKSNKKKKTIKRSMGGKAVDKSLNQIIELKNIDEFFKKSFALLKQTGLNLWGVYPINNPFFMSNKVTTDLRFVIGVVHGYIASHDPKVKMSKKSLSKEDIHQSILYYLRDGGVLRFNNVSFKTVFNAPGGLGTNRYGMNKTAQEYLCKTYPNMAKKKFRPDGTPEVRLIANPEI
tara:strand:- start:270 stop:1163 length:894 start_codon:yes stop_codon:yes gene_type:complete